MPKIMLTGSNGQLGHEFRELASSNKEYDFIFTDIEELDITKEEDLEEFFSVNKPDILINCAAYTAVDKAESDPETALLINAKAVGTLTAICQKFKCYPVHISTDYIFEGQTCKPIAENDPVGPLSLYGKSKLNGERNFAMNTDKGLVIRTSWLYSAFGNNFVKTILKLGKERDELKVVFDQTGSPTWARDLAETILFILPEVIRKNSIEIYHFSNEGVCSWFDIAVASLKIAGINCKVSPILTNEYPMPAPRPAYSVLNKARIRKSFGIEIPYWRTSLEHCIRQIVSNTEEI
jgi:dTDP-4-dehydrorhamnose reductase